MSEPDPDDDASPPVRRLREALRRLADQTRGRPPTGLTHHDADDDTGTAGTDDAAGFDPLPLLRALDLAGARVVVIGQVAGIMHGSRELTGDLDLLWDGDKIAIDQQGVVRREAEVDDEAEVEGEAEPEVEAEVEVEADEIDDETDVDADEEPQVTEWFEPDDAPEPQPEPEPAIALQIETPPPHPKRREPLRANRRQRVEPPIPDFPADATDFGRVRVRVRTQAVEDPNPSGNGPVFHSDLAQPAGELSPFPSPNLSPGSPTDPLSIPQPIEPLPRRWRRRPSRRR